MRNILNRFLNMRSFCKKIMMKQIIIGIFLLVLLSPLSGQKAAHEKPFGEYAYSSPNYSFMENLILQKNSTFSYSVERHIGVTQAIEGNYSVVNDTLILNSNPKKEKIIVKEKYTKGRKKYFKVSDKQNHPINYHLYIITDDGSIIEKRNQFDQTKIRINSVSAFYIVLTNGIVTPTYRTGIGRANYFEIKVEELRVFDDEKWLIQNDKEIIPLGLDGKYVNYSLKKIN